MSHDGLIHPSRDCAEQVAAIETQLSAMTADRDLWREAHNEDCPNVARVASLEAQVQQLRTITDDVVSIMETYHEQEKSAGGVETPGGLEHMGDVWRLLEKWARAAISATEPRP